MRINVIWKIFLIVIVIVFSGCSSAEKNPIDTNSLTDERIQIGITDWDSQGNISAGTGTLGLFNLSINPEKVSAEIIPFRNLSLTDVLEVVDITNFLQLAPCTDCIKLQSVSLNSDGNIVLSIGIKHPFPAGDALKPITGQNRGDLHVFNVEGIVISNTGNLQFTNVGESAADFLLVNADGYTGYLDNSLDEFYQSDATVHPYITHFDDYSVGNFDALNPMGFASVTDPPPSGNLIMAMGADYDYQDYIFAPTPSMEFLFAVGCTYAVSASDKSQRFSPEYRVPQHNKKSASEISVWIIQNELMGGIPTSTAEIEIHVVDISHGVAVGEDLDEMFADSSVDDIFIEIPGVTDSMVILDGNNPLSGTGHDPSDPLVYSATITNSSSGDMGVYMGIVKVSDSYAAGQNTNPMLGGNDGISRVDPLINPLTGTFEIAEFASYLVFTIEVGNPCGPVTGSILSPDCPVESASNGQTIDFTVEASSANGGGNIVLFELDYDYDGLLFSVDDSNLDGIFNDTGPFTVEDPCEDNIPHDYTVAFRATDECVPPNVTIFATCIVTVDSCLTPVGNVKLIVNYIDADIIPPASIPHGYQFDYDGPFTLEWDAVTGAAEYAIYYDNDPSDGLKTEPLIFVGTTSTSSYTVPASHLPSSHFIDGYTYYVCSRATAGGPNAPESESAYVTISGYESGEYFDSECEGWVSHCQANTTDFRYRPYVDGWGGIHIHGPNNVFFSNQFFGPDDNNRWHGWAKETEVVPDSTVRYLSFSARSYYIWPEHGMFIGTISGTDLPQYNWTTPEDMQWASVDSINGFDGYDYICGDVYNTFTDVPNENNAWYTQYNPPFDLNWYNFLCGGDVNIGGTTSNSEDPFVAIEIVKLLLDYRAPQTVIDETAIAIY